MRMYAYMQDDGSYKMFRRATRPCVRFVVKLVYLDYTAVLSHNLRGISVHCYQSAVIFALL